MKKSLLALAAMAFSLHASAAITIKFSHVVAPSTPKGRMAEKFKELIEARSNGEIKVAVFPNSQLYNDNKVLEALLMGDVQMAAPTTSKLTRMSRKLQVFDLPFLFKDTQAVNRFEKSPAGQALLGSMQNKGIIGLGYLNHGFRQLSANFPIHNPLDMKGKKFRVEASDVLAANMEAVGSSRVKKPFSEVFTLLQTKAIDGQESPWPNTYSKKFHEVQSYITESNTSFLDYIVITSKKFMDSLTPAQQKLVRDAATDAIDYGNGLARQLCDEDRGKIKESGYTKIIELTPQEKQKWIDAMRPVYKQFEKAIGKDIIEAAEASNTPSD